MWRLHAGPKGEGGLDDATGAGGSGGASHKQTSAVVDLGMWQHAVLDSTAQYCCWAKDDWKVVFFESMRRACMTSCRLGGSLPVRCVSLPGHGLT